MGERVVCVLGGGLKQADEAPTTRAVRYPALPPSGALPTRPQVLPGGVAAQVASFAKQNTEAGATKPFHPRHRWEQRHKQDAEKGPSSPA